MNHAKTFTLARRMTEKNEPDLLRKYRVDVSVILRCNPRKIFSHCFLVGHGIFCTYAPSEEDYMNGKFSYRAVR